MVRLGLAGDRRTQRRFADVRFRHGIALLLESAVPRTGVPLVSAGFASVHRPSGDPSLADTRRTALRPVERALVPPARRLGAGISGLTCSTRGDRGCGLVRGGHAGSRLDQQVQGSSPSRRTQRRPAPRATLPVLGALRVCSSAQRWTLRATTLSRSESGIPRRPAHGSGDQDAQRPGSDASTARAPTVCRADAGHQQLAAANRSI